MRQAFTMYYFLRDRNSCHEVTILGYEIEDGEKLLELPKKTDKRIEVYGDSVSAGEVSEAVEFVGKEDPEHEGGYSNSYYSYGWIWQENWGHRYMTLLREESHLWMARAGITNRSR